jgi:hypothetical protein
MRAEQRGFLVNDLNAEEERLSIRNILQNPRLCLKWQPRLLGGCRFQARFLRDDYVVDLTLSHLISVFDARAKGQMGDRWIDGRAVGVVQGGRRGGQAGTKS